MMHSLTLYNIRTKLFSKSKGKCEVCGKSMKFNKILMVEKNVEDFLDEKNFAVVCSSECREELLRRQI